MQGRPVQGQAVQGPAGAPRNRAETAGCAGRVGRVFVLIVGSGRVGSAIAKAMLADGNEVSVLDEDPEAIALLERGQTRGWEDLGGSFTVGTALELDALVEAGIERADAFIASTDGDNTNLVIAQIAQRRFKVEKVVVRVLDPYRAQWYREQGLLTVCPTQVAIEMLQAAVRDEMDTAEMSTIVREQLVTEGTNRGS